MFMFYDGSCFLNFVNFRDTAPLRLDRSGLPDFQSLKHRRLSCRTSPAAKREERRLYSQVDCNMNVSLIVCSL